MNLKIIHRANARRIIARRHPDGTYSLTVPAGMAENDWRPIARKLLDSFNNEASAQWTPRFHSGQTIECGQFTITLTEQSAKPDFVIATRTGSLINIAKGSALEWGTRHTDMNINSLLMKVAHSIAPHILLPEAKATAARLGVEVKGWKISNGHKTLGSCRSDGMINLSHINVFLPEHLRNYIVCHELAHRSEMNHSPGFHRICNRYLDGAEAELKRELKSYNWPIIR